MADQEAYVLTAGEYSLFVRMARAFLGGGDFTPQQRPQNRQTTARGFPAEITGFDPATKRHSWKLLKADWLTDSVTETIGTLNARDIYDRLVQPGTRVWMLPEGQALATDEYTRAFVFAAELIGDLFAVLLEEDGGSDGDKTTAPTYTYTCKSLDDATTYATAQSPVKARRFGKFTSGDGLVGTAYFDADGTFVLFDANEAESPLGCPE